MKHINSIVEEDIKEIINNLGTESKKLIGSSILVTGANGMLAKYMVLTLIELNKKLETKAENLVKQLCAFRSSLKSH